LIECWHSGRGTGALFQLEDACFECRDTFLQLLSIGGPGRTAAHDFVDNPNEGAEALVRLAEAFLDLAEAAVGLFAEGALRFGEVFDDTDQSAEVGFEALEAGIGGGFMAGLRLEQMLQAALDPVEAVTVGGLLLVKGHSRC
jgi:hypothetical protein